MPLDDAQNQEIESAYQASLANKTKNTQLSDSQNQEIESLYQQSLKSGEGPKGVVQTVGNWFTGSKSTEFPDMPAFAPTNILSPAFEGEGLGTRLKVMAGALLTPDLKTQADVILNSQKGSSLSQDKFGNPIIILRDGKTFYLNKPGADIEDVTQLTSQILQYAPGAGYITKTFAGDLLKRSLAQGALGAGVSMGQDIATIPLGGEGVNYGKAAINAAIPFATELALTPAVNAFFNKFGKNKEFFTVDLNGTPTLTEKGISAARAAGVDVSNLDKGALNKKFTELAQRSQTGNPALNKLQEAYNKWKIENPSAESEKQFGIKLTQSQQAGDKIGVATLYGAVDGRYGPVVQSLAKEFLDEQNISVANAAKDLLSRFDKGEIKFKDLEGSGEQIISTIRNNFNKKSNEVKTAYNLVNTDAIYLGGNSNLDVLETSFTKALQDASGNTVDPALTPGTIFVQRELKNFLDKIKGGSAIESAGEAGKIQYVKPTIYNDFVSMRKKFDSGYKGAAKEGPDKLNILALKEEFDKFTDDAIDNALFGSGENPLVLDAVKKARQTFQEKQKLYGVNRKVKDGIIINDPAGKVIQKIIQDDTITPTNTIDYIFGTADIGAKNDSLQIVRRLKKVFDAEDMTKPNGDFDALKQAFVQKITKNATNDATNEFVPQKLVTQWNATQRKYPDLINELFTKPEQKYLTDFVNTVRKTLKPTEKNLEQPIGLINKLILTAGAIVSGNVGIQAGNLYGGMAARSLWTQVVDSFHRSQAKKMVMQQLKQKPGALDNLGEPVSPGKALADMFNKATGAQYQAPSIGGTAAPVGQTFFNDVQEKKINERPLISLPAAQRGIAKTQPRAEIPTLDRNMITASTTPTAGGITNIPQDQLDKYTSLFGKVV
jgi:hypothetical protein